MTGAPAPWRDASARSPAVSLAIAIAMLGCLLAAGAESSLPHFALSAALLFSASEIEVRSLRLPLSFGLAALMVILAWLGWSEGPIALAIGFAGAIFFPFLLAPFLATGYIGHGTLAASAALGALWGPRLVPAVFLVGLALGAAFIASRATRNADLRTLPMTTVIGFAAALVQLIR
jgi:hypothetical protein